MEGRAENASGERCDGTAYWREPMTVSLVVPDVTMRVPLAVDPTGTRSSPGVLVRLHDHSGASATKGGKKQNSRMIYS